MSHSSNGVVGFYTLIMTVVGCLTLINIFQPHYLDLDPSSRALCLCTVLTGVWKQVSGQRPQCSVHEAGAEAARVSRLSTVVTFMLDCSG